ncbi:hypothetical protein PV08_08316 [Exophiala spinifera]|uniref:Heterokaryon incompatibility domain-containing protein n=1 Tax=Exophiala spinifera TaxID=91928 RepID=A0A0D2BPT2_9EURO|nr:uncharacterized protein PV08_08316 [Exophiala spinifera]KIW13129.1 hypothetical protein PV08_08316 [Exophiala spinifera]
MRLLDTTTLQLKEFADENEVEYIILSHRWEQDEVSLQQLPSLGTRSRKQGYLKIRACCAEAARNGVRYAWIDTCCIDKTSSAELNGTAMQPGAMRIYPMSGLSMILRAVFGSLGVGLYKSFWSTLLNPNQYTYRLTMAIQAPHAVEFYNRRWEFIGSKHLLSSRLSGITGVPRDVLWGDRPPSGCPIAQRMSWASKRVTTRPEDQAYSLMGLFDVNMPLLYGEGKKAFRRLQEEILKISQDHSIFIWKCTGNDGPLDMLAGSPADFADRRYVSPRYSGSEQYLMTNAGLSITLPMLPWNMNTYLAILGCNHQRGVRARADGYCSAIFLQRTKNPRLLIRVALSGQEICTVKRRAVSQIIRMQQVLILSPRVPAFPDSDFVYGQPAYGFVFLSSMSSHLIDIGPKGLPGVEIGSRNPPEPYQTSLQDKPAWKVKLLPGQHGTVAWFDFAKTEKPPGKIRLVKFGFDFEFNPVCMIWTHDHLSRNSWVDQQGRALESSTLDSNEWIEKDVASHGIDVSSGYTEVGGELRPYYALRGDNSSGISVGIQALELTIDIATGRGDRDPEWFVTMEDTFDFEAQDKSEFYRRDRRFGWRSKKDVIVEERVEGDVDTAL